MISKRVVEHNGMTLTNYDTSQEYDGVLTFSKDHKYILGGKASFCFLKGSYKYPDQFQVIITSRSPPMVTHRSVSNSEYNRVEVCITKNDFIDMLKQALTDGVLNDLGGMKMDLKQELERMRAYKGENYFKAQEGKQVLVIIGEPEDDSFLDKDGKRVDQAKFHIQYKEEDYSWSVPKGKSLKSLFGQLCLVAESRGGLFNGMKVSLVAEGKGKDIRYTVLEAKELAPEV